VFRTLGYIGTNFARSEQSFVLTRNERAEALPNPPLHPEIATVNGVAPPRIATPVDRDVQHHGGSKVQGWGALVASRLHLTQPAHTRAQRGE
jgi:hypothetical protein